MKPTDMEIRYALDMIEDLMGTGLKDALRYVADEDNAKWYHLNISQWLDKNIDYLNKNGIRYCTGSTKLVFLTNELENWVIKLNFDRSTDPYYVEEGLVMDFCQIEADNYQRAVENDLGEYFAATYNVGKVNDTNVYLQEKAEVDEYFFDRMVEYAKDRELVKREDFEDEEEYREALEQCVWEDFDEEDRLEAVFGGEVDRLCKLFDFVDDNEINDLHENNFGITPDGRYLVIDFSGFSD